MVILPCLSWFVTSFTYLFRVFLLVFFGGLIRFMIRR